MKNRLLANLKIINRGFLFLKKNNKLYLIEEIRNSLITSKLKINNAWALQKILQKEDFEKCLRTLLFQNLINKEFNRNLLISFGSNSKISYHLPGQWVQCLSPLIKVNRWKTELKWRAYLLFRWSKGTVLIFTIILLNLNPYSRQKYKNKNKILIKNLHLEEMFPLKSKNSYCFINWLIKQEKLKKYFIFHENKKIKKILLKSNCIKYINFFSAINKKKKLLKFIINSAVEFYISFIDFIFKDGFRTFLFPEMVEALYFQQSDIFYDKIFFNNSCTARPIWTYLAERKGSKIIFCFFSANADSIKIKKNYSPTPAHFKCMNWPVYFVWTKAQESFVRRCTKEKPKIKVTGPIWSYDSPAKIKNKPKNFISVFDVPPRRKSSFSILCDQTILYKDDNVIQFLVDIYEKAVKSKKTILFKTKRNILSSNDISKKYLKMLLKYRSKPFFKVIEANVSAQKVIEKSSCTISLPYSSTAFIAQSLNKPSYFYDPTCSVKKGDRAANGIHLISGKKQLLSFKLTK